jgi:hypothetical protein
MGIEWVMGIVERNAPYYKSGDLTRVSYVYPGESKV